jgi:hypothetical protein
MYHAVPKCTTLFLHSTIPFLSGFERSKTDLENQKKAKVKALKPLQMLGLTVIGN